MKPGIALVALAAASTACTELDVLSGSRPDLPWSPLAPRGTALTRSSEVPPYEVSTALAGGSLELVTDLPAAPADCAVDRPPALCADDDGDGLVDEWEDVVLDRFRPFVRIDKGDPLHIDGEGRVASVGRVVPVVAGDGSARIRLFLVLGYSRDYGRCTFGSHLGDSERVVLDLLPGASTDGSARLIGAYTAAHEGSGRDTSRLFEGDEIAALEYADDPATGEPRWAVYSSRAKHATYATAALCEANGSWIFCGDEDCASGRSLDPPNELLMPVVNAGEPDAPRAEEMMDEPVWEDVAFCGGLGHGDGSCASPLREKLLSDPFSPEI